MIYIDIVDLLPDASYQVSKGLLVLEKKIFKDLPYLQPLQPSWLCDLDHLYKLSFPLPKDAPLKIIEDGRTIDGRQSMPTL